MELVASIREKVRSRCMVVIVPLAQNSMQPFYDRNPSSGDGRNAVFRSLPSAWRAVDVAHVSLPDSWDVGTGSNALVPFPKGSLQATMKVMGGLLVWTVLWAMGHGAKR